MKKLFTLLVVVMVTLTSMAQTTEMNFIGTSNFYVQGMKDATTVVTVKDTVQFNNLNVMMMTGDIVIPEMQYTMPGSTRTMTLASFTISNPTYTFDMSTMTATIAEQAYSTTTVDNTGTTKNVEGTISGNYSVATGALTVNCTILYGSLKAMGLTIVYENVGYYTPANAWNLVGQGKKTNPYRIFDAADFQAMAANISADNTGKGEYFEVMNDIDFGGSADNPVQLPSIGKAGITSVTKVAWGFQGTLAGDNHYIKGIYHTNNGSNADGKYNALISSLGEDGYIHNLNIDENNYISTNMYSAAIVAFNKSGIIDICENQANVTGAGAFTAGVCAFIAGGKGTVSNCYNYGAIKSMTYAAGIVAGSQSGAAVGTKDADYSNVIISNCINYGDCSTTNGTGSGGIAGSFSGVIKDCTNKGTIDDTNGTAKTRQYTGGIVGSMTYIAGVTGNSNEGEVKGINYVGGIVGCIMKGANEPFSLTGNDNDGTVTGEKDFGDIIGGSQRSIKGDVNGDFAVNIADVNAVIDVMCGGEANAKADVNGDGEINISDVNAVITIMCGGSSN